MTIYTVRHETTYRYGAPVVTALSEARLEPRQLSRQRVIDTELSIDPGPDTLGRRSDYFGNAVVFFELQRPHRHLTVTAVSRVEARGSSPPAGWTPEPWEAVTASVRQNLGDPFLEAAQYVYDSPSVRRSDELAYYAFSSFTPRRPIVEATVDLTHRIFSDFSYDQGATTVATPIEDVLARRRGVCQDFAHVMIGALRSIGVPARYVSGYVGGDGEVPADELVGAHASHAWVSVFCGQAGWLDVDPTNDHVVSDQHVVIGWGRDYEDLSPIRGVALGGGRHSVTVRVSVRPEPKAGS